jgi:hypothetical protein
MGLIVETIPVHVPASRVCTDGSSSSNYEETGSFDMSIYRILSMQNDMKTIEYPIKVCNEFDLYLQYAEDNYDGIVNVNFDSLDEYLGTIGIITEMCEV